MACFKSRPGWGPSMLSMLLPALATLVAVPAYAVEARDPLTLGAAIRETLSRHPEIERVDAYIRAADAAISAARGDLDPVLSAELSLNREEQTLTDFAGNRQHSALDVYLTQPLVWGTELSVGWGHGLTQADTPFLNCVPGLEGDACHESRLSLQLRQPLLRDRGRAATEAAVDEALAARRKAEREQQSVATALVEQVMERYCDLFLAEVEAHIRRQATQLAQRQLDAAQARVSAGALAPLDLVVVKQAVAARNRAQWQAEQTRDERAWALVAAMGRPVSESRPRLARAARPELPDRSIPPALSPVVARALESHPDLAVLAAEIRRQEIALGPLVNRARPRLDLTANLSRTAFDPDPGRALTQRGGNDFHAYGATMTLELPLRNRTAEGDLARAQHTLSAARAQLSARRLEIRHDVALAWRAVGRAAQQLESAREVRALTQQSLDAEAQKFQVGRATSLDVLTIQQTLAEAQLDIERVHLDRFRAHARLARLQGDLLATILALDPAPP